MKMIIWLKDVPELKGLKASQRVLVHRLCYQRFGFTSWKTWLALLLYGIFGGLGIVLGKTLLLRFGLPFFPAMFTGTLVGASVGFVIFRGIVIAHLRPYYSQCINELK